MYTTALKSNELNRVSYRYITFPFLNEPNKLIILDEVWMD